MVKRYHANVLDSDTFSDWLTEAPSGMELAKACNGRRGYQTRSTQFSTAEYACTETVS